MFLEDKILIGKDEQQNVFLLPKMCNRHGLIAGATGTGKTVTLKVIAEGLSDCGVACFISDIKGDVSGLGKKGSDFVLNRANEMGLDGFNLKQYPVSFLDVYGKLGHPVRASIKDMGPLILGNILELTDAQYGVLAIAFEIANKKGLDLDDLNDLKACLQYVYDKNDELSLEYGNVAKQSVSSIIRNLLVLQQQGAEQFFGLPSFNIHDLMRNDGPNGVISIMDCQKLFQQPKLYVAFLMWLLTKLYDELPEVGDLEKPKIVFFFDEAHLIFKDTPKVLLDKFEQVIKLIRSKGVGIFFCTQNPRDISDNVLAQLGNRIQHALRAYTPNEIKAVKLAAESFRANPNFNTEEMITTLKTGQALISCLDETGTPNIVMKTKVCPPSSSIEALNSDERNILIRSSIIYGKYEERLERESAKETLEKEREIFLRQEEEKKMMEQRLKQEELLEKQRQKEEEKQRIKQEKELEKYREKEERRLERERQKRQERQNYYARRAIGNVTSTFSREITKGLLKSIKNIFKK